MKPDTSIGLIGLGVMGRNLALNLSDKGFGVVAWDPWPEAASWRAGGVVSVETIEALVSALPAPRLIWLMVKAGDPVDDMISRLAPLLSPGDVLIDGGNAHFADTDRRAAALGAKGLNILGLGVSGGAEGARAGPAMMAGGSEAAWKAAAPLLDAVAARDNGTACLSYFGAGGAGHYVKMVHNGIEYAVMQALAEAAHALHFGAGLAWAETAEVLDSAGRGYLAQITSELLRTDDPLGTGPLIDQIDDAAGQKGTGGWCVADALALGQPVPAIAEAVAARQLSSLPRSGATSPAQGGLDASLAVHAAGAVNAATAIALDQGFGLAEAAAAQRGWDINLPAMAHCWRQGSILRMPLMRDLSEGRSEAIPQALDNAAPHLITFTAAALAAGQPVPVLASCAAWLNSRGRRPLPTAIVQGQRDRFGDHGFRRRDREGTHHGPWNETGA